MQLKSAGLREKAKAFTGFVDQLEMEQKSAKMSRDRLIEEISRLEELAKQNKEDIDIATHAIDILTGISDKTVKDAYKFLEENLNAALARMFPKTTRQIRIREYVFRNQYPQLILDLHVGNGIIRSLKSDSGHGVAQITSFMCILALIVITGSRRLVLIDEVASGLSVRNLMILDEIMWAFTEIGFQFLVNEHGYVPRGSYVYYLELEGDVSSVKQEYLAERGVYLQGTSENHGESSRIYTGRNEPESSEPMADVNSELSKFSGNTSGESMILEI